jgi:hypothetical protein
VSATVVCRPDQLLPTVQSLGNIEGKPIVTQSQENQAWHYQRTFTTTIPPNTVFFHNQLLVAGSLDSFASRGGMPCIHY